MEADQSAMPVREAEKWSQSRRQYRTNIAEETTKVFDHTINVFSTIHKAMPLAVSYFSNDIECVELKPLRKVTGSIL